MSKLSAGYDFLGKLGNDLRDLTGLDTLLFELVQNADDASAATAMTFDVTDSALIVWNDGSFSDCGRQEDEEDNDECAGVPDDDGDPVRCDFHSIRRISGHAKREKTGTTGAFGIGFTSVFQVTDYPELISSGCHWTLRYDEHERERIDVCDGCERHHDAPGTTFILPWATDPDSPVRKGLHFGPVEPGVRAGFIAAAADAIAPAIMFLRRLRRIDVTRDGVPHVFVERTDQGRLRELDTGAEPQRLLVLDGAFEQAAQELRERHPTVLGVDVREAEVSIAIPLDEPSDRLALHAVLPTRETTQLGLRLSSSFYPYQDRKRLKFGPTGDAESDWNRAAVRASATTLAAAIDELPTELGAERLWSLLHSLHDVAANVEDAPDGAFASFWEELSERLPDAEAVWTAQERWTTPEHVFLIEPHWRPALDALHALGLEFVHPLIHDHVAAMAVDVGVGYLGAEDLAAAFKQTELTSKRRREELPGSLGTPAGLESLLHVAGDLVGRLSYSDEPLRVFDGCALIPCLDDTVAPPNKVSLEPESTISLFHELPAITFVDSDAVNRIDPRLERLLWELAGWEVVDALAEVRENGTLAAKLEERNIPHVLRWLADHRDSLEPEHVDELRSIPIFPSARGLARLIELELPGPFDSDPLEITDTVDLRGIDDLRDFLGERCLGARTLDLDVYIQNRLVPAFEASRQFADAQLDALIAVLADKLDDLDEDEDAIDALGGLALIPTRGAGRLPAHDSYFDAEIVQSVLGQHAIVTFRGRKLRKLKPLLESLGVQDEPRAEDVVAAVAAIVAVPKSEDRVDKVRAIVEYLGPKFKFGTDEERRSREAELDEGFGELKTLAWLPASKGGWATPTALHRTDWRRAFETTGNFIQLVEKTVQQPNADFLELLGVSLRPRPELVIAHLLDAVEKDVPVRKRVYEALDGASAASLTPVLARPCILVSDAPVTYARPSEVVRDPGPLRPYLYALPSALSGFHDLATALEIADAPTEESAALVIKRIAAEAPAGASSGQVAALHHCWRILDEELERVAEDDHEEHDQLKEWIADELGGERCWPDRSRILSVPAALFVDDLPALRRFVPDDVVALLIDRPPVGVLALRAAGLRFLSHALTEEVVHVPHQRADDELEALLRTRHDALARVVSAAELPADGLARLLALDFIRTDAITLHRWIEEPELDLGEQSVAAHLNEPEGRLFVTQAVDSSPTQLAVEIARLLCTEQFSPGVASNIEKVLTADSSHAAHDALDLLQIARLGSEVADDGAPEPETETLFQDEDADDDYPEDADVEQSDHERDDSATSDDAAEQIDSSGIEPTGSSDALAAEDAASSDGVEPAVDDQPVGEAELERDDVAPRANDPSLDGRAGGQGASRHDGLRRGSGAAHHHSQGANGAHRVASDRSDKPNPTQPEAPWRIWVSGRRGAHQERVATSEGTKRLREDVATRGVERVLQYEREHGRVAAEMGTNNEGYDVESSNGPQRPVVRRIEVKSLGGTWEAEWGTAGQPPQMTAPQLRMSFDDGRHWLYVVERALDDAAWCVYPIQAVGKRANRYLIDHGWKEAADRPAGPGLAPRPEQPVAATPLPDPTTMLFGRDERDDGDVPFLDWDALARVGTDESVEEAESWFTSPTDAIDGDFAVQQRDAAMGLTLPRGSIAVFRPLTGRVADDIVVIANVGPDDAERRYEIRRARILLDDRGEVERLLLNVDVPGTAAEYEFAGTEASTRVLAVLVGQQRV